MTREPGRKTFTERHTGMTIAAMTTRKQKQDFLERLDDMMDQVPISQDEALQVLAEENIDGDAAWQRIKARILVWEEEQASRHRSERFARARERREAVLARVADKFARRERELAARPREELLAMLAGRNRHGAPMQVFHRKLTEMSSEDLASLIAHDEDADEEAKRR